MIHFTYLCRWVIISTNTIFLWFSLPAAFYAFLMYHFTWKLRIWGIGDLWKITASLYHEPDFNLKCELSELISFFYLGWSPLNFAESYVIIAVAHSISVNLKEQVLQPRQSKLEVLTYVCFWIESQNDRGSPGSSSLYNVSLMLKLPERKDQQEIKCIFSRPLNCFPLVWFLGFWGFWGFFFWLVGWLVFFSFS